MSEQDGGLLADLQEQMSRKPVDKTVDKTADKEAGKAQKRNPAVVIADAVISKYDLGCTPDGEAYVVPKPEYCKNPRGILATKLGTKGGAFRAEVRRQMYRSFGEVVTDGALDGGLSVVIAEAQALDERVPLHLRVAAEPGRIVLDLGRPNDASCVIITPECWKVADCPPDGILFDRRRTTWALPDPVVGGTFEPLRVVLGFKASDPDWLLIRGWMVASLLPGIPRPILLFLGAAGSAKTNRAKAVVDTLDPRQHLGSSFGKSLDDDRVSAAGRFLVGWDNVSKMSADVSDHLCRLVTGDSAEKKQLYTDGDVYSISYRRTGVMTAVNLPPMKPDALERIIPLHLGRLGDEDRVAEQVINERLGRAHPAALGAVCDGAVRLLKNLPGILAQKQTGPRMMDYWAALLAYDPACAKAYAGSVDRVLAEAALDDPFLAVVRAWLEQNNWHWAGQAQQAYEACSMVRLLMPAHSGQDGWWPANAAWFIRKLTEQERPLEKLEIRMARSHNKQGGTLAIGHVNAPQWI